MTGSSPHSNVDYTTMFEKPDLTPIMGEPTYETLERLLKELQANARQVHSNLGGGNHGHLGLVLSPTSYALISAILFARPIFPGSQVITPPELLSINPMYFDFSSTKLYVFIMK